MKRTTTLSLALLTAVSAFAQNNRLNKHFNQPDKYQRIIQRILDNNARTTGAQKTTVVEQRVIAEAGYGVTGSNLTQDDSTYFNYGTSATRGSRFDLNSSYHNYYFPSNDLGLFPLEAGKTDVMADVIKYWDLSSSTSIPQEDVAISYNGSDNIADYKYINADPANNFRYVNDYDAQGRIILATILTSSNNVDWDTAARRWVTYNAQDQVLTDSLFAYDQGDWVPAQSIDYTYNGSGQLTEEALHVSNGTSFVDYYTVGMTYYPGGDIQTVTITVNQGGGLMPYEKDSFASAPANDYQTLHQIWQYDNGSSTWVPYSKDVYSVNAQNLPDTTRSYSWDGSAWQEESVMASTFNSYNNPEMEKTYFPDGAGGYTYSYLYKFYYETYTVNDVKEIAQNAAITLYPNPAAETINLSWKNAESKPVAIELVNASGQKVRSESFTWAGTTQQFSLNGIAPGIYFLSVRNHTGEVVFRQSIIKQ